MSHGHEPLVEDDSSIVPDRIPQLAELYGEVDARGTKIDIQAMLIDVIGLAKVTIAQGNGQSKADFMAWVEELWDAVEIEYAVNRTQ